jgi:hypothetical protein
MIAMNDETIICCICGLLILNNERKNREHLLPLSRGGNRKDWQWAHSICNSIKADLTMNEFEQQARERYIKALKWNVKYRDKRTIKRVLLNKEYTR